MDKGAFLFLGALSFACADNTEDAVGPRHGMSDAGDVRADTPERRREPLTWGLVISTMQIVHEAVDPALCPSGWTMVQEELAREGNGQLSPLQAAYVNRFANLYEFTRAAIAARADIRDDIPTLRLSTVWPCWAGNGQWGNEMAQTIRALLDAGWHVELSLLHHDSYPAALHGKDGFLLGGWAHESAQSAFGAYVASVVKKLRGVLPQGSRIYVANELEGSLFNGHLDQTGKWPPGGKNAGKSMGRAFQNAREALYEAAVTLRAAGFEPAIAVNVRPLILGSDTAPARTLDLLHNWWLLNALVRGCQDDAFTGSCERTREPVIDVIGLTYYGHMLEGVEQIPITDTATIVRPAIIVEPDAGNFQRALRTLRDTYDGTVGVAEIGFSSGSLSRATEWLRMYKDAVKLELGYEQQHFIQLYTLFEGAEFSEGEWHFHLLDGCGDEESCQFTPWGMQVLEVIEQGP